jgi:hypothetical protein
MRRLHTTLSPTRDARAQRASSSSTVLMARWCALRIRSVWAVLPCELTRLVVLVRARTLKTNIGQCGDELPKCDWFRTKRKLFACVQSGRFGLTNLDASPR